MKYQEKNLRGKKKKSWYRATAAAAAVAARRPTLKRDTSTVLYGAHVHGFASNLVGYAHRY